MHQRQRDETLRTSAETERADARPEREGGREGGRGWKEGGGRAIDDRAVSKECRTTPLRGERPATAAGGTEGEGKSTGTGGEEACFAASRQLELVVGSAERFVESGAGRCHDLVCAKRPVRESS